MNKSKKGFWMLLKVTLTTFVLCIGLLFLANFLKINGEILSSFIISVTSVIEIIIYFLWVMKHNKKTNKII